MCDKIEAKIRYLEMIQNVIQRMASNSFQLKGWAVTLVGIMGAITFNNIDMIVHALLFLPLFAFWGLDAYYLMLERRYRLLYKNVAVGNKVVDFALEPYMEQAECDSDERLQFWNCFWSVTEKGFYLPVGFFVAVIMLVKVFFK